MLLSGKWPAVSTWEALVKKAALMGPLFGEEGKLKPGGLSSHSWEGYVGVGVKINT